MNLCHRLLYFLGFVGFLAVSSATTAQSVSPRIRGPIEPTPSVPLRASLNPHIGFADDLGAVPPDSQIPGVTMVLARSPEQQSALDQLLADQNNSSSPLFHRWLTPAEFADRFGPAPADIAATKVWLQSRGFILDPGSSGADRITFSGTAAQIHNAFGAELHRFLWHNELHFAPATDLSLPSSLALVTAAVLHLSDFRPKPSVHPHPNYTTVSGVHYLAPDDIFTMYDLTPFAPANAVNTIGQGQYVAVVGQSFINVTPANSGIYTFQTEVGGGSAIHLVIVPNSGSEAVFRGDEGESDIDVEYAGGIAKNATLFFVYTGSSSNYDVFDALSYAITQNIAPVISISYGECEPLMSSADIQQYGAVLQEAAAQGQTVVASSGDSGSTACAVYGASSGVSTAQQTALAVNFPADSPYVTAIGGTQMAAGTFATGSSQYWVPANSATSLDNKDSLLSYVPEVVWNESSTSDGIVTSGGGASTLFQRPSWQTGVPGIPAGSFRLVPDIAIQSSTANPGYIICSDDPTLTGAQSDCTGISLQTSNGVYAIAGGTSFAAPIFAGSLALLNEYEHSHGLGNINPVLYSLASKPSIYLSAFHDITTGTSACVSGDGACSTAGQSNFAAASGYDQATGLGSVDFANLAAVWPTTPAMSLIGTYAAFTSGGDFAMDGTATAGASVSLSIAITSTRGSDGGFTAPTGTASVSLDGQPLESSLTLNYPSPTNVESSADFTFTAPSTTGSHILLVNYPGDATHAASSGTYSLLVGNVVPAGSIAISVANVSLAANSVGSTQITITPSGGYNGALTWTVGLTGGTTETTYCYEINAPAINGQTTGTIHLGVGTACDPPTTLWSRSTSQRASLDSQRIPNRPCLAGERLAPALALLLFIILPRCRRKPPPFLAALLLLALPIGLFGCGGASGTTGGGGGGGGGSQAQTYTVTLKAQDSVNSVITASTTFTLTVTSRLGALNSARAALNGHAHVPRN